MREKRQTDKQTDNCGDIISTLLSPISIIWYQPLGIGWEGNRGSGVALAMCHIHEWFIDARAGSRETRTLHTDTPHGM